MLYFFDKKSKYQRAYYSIALVYISADANEFKINEQHHIKELHKFWAFCYFYEQLNHVLNINNQIPFMCTNHLI
jgi:hypothetical protein